MSQQRSEGNFPPPFPCPFPLTHPVQFWEYPFVFNSLKIGNKNCGVNTIPRAQGVAVVSYVLGVYMVLMKGDACVSFWEDSFDSKLKVLVHFLRVKRDRRATSPHPLHALFSSNPSDKNFARAFFQTVQRSYDENSWVDTIPQGPGAGIVSYARRHMWFL